MKIWNNWSVEVKLDENLTATYVDGGIFFEFQTLDQATKESICDFIKKTDEDKWLLFNEAHNFDSSISLYSQNPAYLMRELYEWRKNGTLKTVKRNPYISTWLKESIRKFESGELAEEANEYRRKKKEEDRQNYWLLVAIWALLLTIAITVLLAH